VLSNSIYLKNELVNELAERINGARKLYGQDSAYVIGLITAIDWIAAEADGGEALKLALHSRIDSDASPVTMASAPARSEREVDERPVTTGDTLAENTWIKGAVKWFNNDKGYGFISTESQVDVFVHWRDISSWDRSLVQGDEVEFMVTRTAKGYQAINVMKAGGEEQAEGQDEVSDADPIEEGHAEINAGEEPAGGEGNEETLNDEALSAEDGENAY
jgi:cold shock protein